ncbi:MAG: 16S rRNA (guanine(527)-N(7))-methyltransferase RsmG [Actinomycetota bacterium]|nr:16S rRNA (guanine(527)-N(7))-methyltransferase RsmG [Actinomycetota bacterium]
MKGIEEILIEGARIFGVALTPQRVNAFLFYLDELKKWNRRVNLTSLKDDRDIVVKHFLDSLSCLVSDKIEGYSKVVDVGTGAGFPGLPIKIARPKIELTLLDSSKRRAQFLIYMVEALKLEDSQVVCLRAEEFARKEKVRESFDIVLARAVSSLPVLMEYTLPLLKIGGYFIAQKSQKLKNELEVSQRAASILGGEVEKVMDIAIPFLNAQRYLVLTKKAMPTADRYPRRTGIPTKRPLGFCSKNFKKFHFLEKEF